jgi:hypothetical protein
VKKRMQIQVLENTIQGATGAPKYSGIVHCFSKTFRDEGIAGLYKVGRVPRVAY